MKKGKVYLETLHFCWFCPKCGKPMYFQVEPQGIFSINGHHYGTPKDVKRGYFIIRCNRTSMLVSSCNCKRKIYIKDVPLKRISAKKAQKFNDLHSANLKKEDKLRYARMEINMRKRLTKEIEVKLKKERKQRLLFKKSKKRKKK